MLTLKPFNFLHMLHVNHKLTLTKEFTKQRIPRPRDLFSRYGAGVDKRASHSTSAGKVSTPAVTTHTVIGQLKAAQKMLDDLPKKE